MQSLPFQPMTDELSNKNKKALGLALHASARGSAGHILWTLRRSGIENDFDTIIILSHALAILGSSSAENYKVDL